MQFVKLQAVLAQHIGAVGQVVRMGGDVPEGAGLLAAHHLVLVVGDEVGHDADLLVVGAHAHGGAPVAHDGLRRDVGMVADHGVLEAFHGVFHGGEPAEIVGDERLHEGIQGMRGGGLREDARGGHFVQGLLRDVAVVDEDEVVGFQVERHGVRIARGVGFVRHRERADDVGGVQLDEVGRRQLERRQLCPRLRSDMRELAELVGGEDLDQGRLAAFLVAGRCQRVRPVQVVNGCHGSSSRRAASRARNLV